MNINVAEEYKLYCYEQGVQFDLSGDKVNPYDNTTLFCPSGMQQFKSNFADENFNEKTIANIQSCIRMNDFDEIGDTTHLLYFNMMGFFSFRDKSIEWAIDFWMKFLVDILNLKIDYITVHSTCYEEWKQYYDKYDIEIRVDDENCTWTDGNIGGYCTEFFINDVEIGNIVNPLGTCIDVGFGLERLEMFVNNVTNKTKAQTLIETINKIIDSGYKPSNLKQGYILRKLLRELYKSGGTINHPFFQDEIKRQEEILKTYNRLKNKHADKSKEWWLESVGINLDDLE